MGSVGKPKIYSDVDARTTPLSSDDRYTVADNSALSYFQSSDSFYINEALRLATDENISVEDALKRVAETNFWWDAKSVPLAKNVIDAMDRNMQPINKEMRTIRMADSKFLDRVLRQAGVPEDIREPVMRAMNSSGLMPTDKQLDALNSFLVGGTVYENAYMSSSYNLTMSDSAFKERRIMIDSRISAGAKGMFSPTRDESEFVLNRHAGYIIKGIVKTPDNKLRILTDVNP